MLTIDLFEELQGPPEPTLIDALRDFLPIAVKHLEIKELPKIKLVDEVETDHMPSFGKFSNDDRTVHLGIKNRHPNDVLRTLAHEMAHYAQGERDELDADSWHTGSPVENEANAQAGVIMREFNEQFPQYMELKPIMLEKWSKKYKKSINCSNPKGFSQKAHCAGRKKHTNVAEGGSETSWSNDADTITLQDILELTKHIKQINLPINDNLKNKLIHWDGNPEEIERINQVTVSNQFPILVMVDEQGQINWILDGNHRLHKAIQSQAKTIPAKLIKPSDLSDKAKRIFQTEGKHCDAKNAVPELKAALTKRKTELKNSSAKVAYDKIDKIMTRIAQTYNISGQELHDLWTERYGEIPDTWVLDENFADGKGPGKPGDSQRHGIPKGATISQLEKASHSAGRKGQLARWQLNMRRGHKK